MRILLVEDNAMTREMLTRRLSRRGYQVLLAGDGEEGLRKARTELPELILLDMRLPGRDGWTVARELKADPRTARVPVIALTAHAMAGDRELILAAGCDDYHTKPVDLERLLEKIVKLTGS